MWSVQPEDAGLCTRLMRGAGWVTLCLTLWGCTPPTPPPTDQAAPTIAATFYPTEFFASRIAGYRALPAQFGLARARCSLIITLFAFHRYVAEKKTPPATLDQLRGQYVLDIPIDPFSANPVLYDKNRGWLWSVGTDLKTQGGLPTSPPMRDEREPTVETGIRIAVEASR